MKYGKRVALIIFLIVMFGVGYLIYQHLPSNAWILQPLVHPTIKWQQDNRMIFLKEGIVITGEDTTFYDSNGQIASFPYSFESLENQNYRITDITSGYVLIDKKTIYKIESGNLVHFYDLVYPVVKMEEYPDYLLLIEEDEAGMLVPKFLDVENLMLFDFGFEKDLYFVDTSTPQKDTSLSILTLDVSSPFPSSKVLHYDGKPTLIGVITAIDQVFYNVFRYPQHTILFGNQGIVCYNMENEIEWTIETRYSSDFQIAQNEYGLLVGLDHFVGVDNSTELYNAIFIDKNGGKKGITLPIHLKSISPYKDKFTGIQYGKKLLIFDRDGKIEEEYPIDKDATRVTWNPYDDSKLLILHQDDTLQIYSIEQEDNS